MGRVRKANEDAIEKTIKFLINLKNSCDFDLPIHLSLDAEAFSISKSTGNICKKLGIIKAKGYSFEWTKSEPGRHLALIILEELRKRQQKTVESVKLPGFEDYFARIETLLTEIRDNTVLEVNGLDVTEISQEQKHKDRLYLIGQIASGIFTGRVLGDLPMCNIVELCKTVIVISNELSNQLYSK